MATAGLGALAGLTIFLGLPIARLGRPGASRMAFLNAASVGVLLFIFYDVIKAAAAPIEATISDGATAQGIGYGVLLAMGMGVGLLGLVLFEKFFKRRSPRVGMDGPGAMAVAAAETHPGGLTGVSRIAFLIAVGIGFHNFSEGLAIGQSAHAGSYQLFGLLVIGFGLHNITEGFGITAPLAGTRPSWRFLGLLGVIGGGPTLVGTLLGYSFTSLAVSVLFFGLAAGAILYVVGELQHVGRKIGRHDVAMVGLLCGFVAGLATDILLGVAGA